MTGDLNIKKIYLCTGFSDLRRGVDELAALIKCKFSLEPMESNTMFLFCGRRTDRIKGLMWSGDRWLLLYMRLETGGFAWPRNTSEALRITADQYRALMQGLEIVPRRPIQEFGDLEYTL